MIVKLDTDEVKAALMKAIEEKTSYIFGQVDEDWCWFNVSNPNGQIEDIETVEFSVEFP